MSVPPSGPIVIGHRGAPGLRPEHTLAGYALAIELGADFIEPDLVPTRDGVLVARHENEISSTTDVAAHAEFADRRTTKVVDRTPVSGWFTEDFTLDELRRLRARERLPELRPANATHDGEDAIPTFDEILELVRREEHARGRPIGVYPELKHPSHVAAIGLPLEAAVVAALDRHGYRDATAPVFVQSFEVGPLRRLRTMTDVRLVQLLDSEGAPVDLVEAGDPRSFADLGTPDGLAFVATYADAIGPGKDLVIGRDHDGALGRPTSLVADAHAAGLLVHAWTFRAENAFLPTDLQLGDRTDPAFAAAHGDWAAELAAFLATGLDGVFADQPDLAVLARSAAFARPSR